MFEKDEATTTTANPRICVLCNKLYSTSSELVMHHHTSHSKKELSKALMHLQYLLIQLKLLKPISEESGRNDRKGVEMGHYQDSGQHFLYNCMEVNDVKVLLEKSEFNLDKTNVKSWDKCEDNTEVKGHLNTFTNFCSLALQIISYYKQYILKIRVGYHFCIPLYSLLGWEYTNPNGYR